MNLPKVIRVGGVFYDVNIVNNLHDRGEKLNGWVTFDNTKIQLDSDMSIHRKKNVLIHELVHAMLYEAGYDEQDEELVRRLSNVLTTVLRDNDFSFMRDEEDE